MPGLSIVLNANSSNYGNMFVIFKPFHERRDPSLAGEAIVGHLRGRLRREVPEARVLAFGPPAVRGLGNAGGFKLMVEATGDVNFDALQARADNLAAQGNQQPGLVGLFNGFRARTPQLYADIDRTKVRTMGVALTDVFDALQAYLGSYYVNDFNRFGRTWQVNIQADAPFRVDAETVKQLKVRNADGDMVPLGAVVDIRESAGPVTITRYNMFPAATITGSWQPGVSTGEVLRTMEELSDKELPRSMTYEWTELSYLQKQASKVEQFRDLRQNPFSAFVLGAVLVFFVLAGLYESWSLPMAVILVVPMCVLCRAHRRRGPRHGQQHLHPDRLRGADRPGLQERHPDRRVRPRPPAGRRVPVRRRRGGRPGAAAADRDDLGVLHPHGAALLRGRRRRRDAPIAGHRRAVGRLRRDPVRHLPDAGLLLRGAPAQWPGAGQARAPAPVRRGTRRDGPGRPGLGDRRALSMRTTVKPNTQALTSCAPGPAVEGIDRGFRKPPSV